jgi:hypothetical protein
MRAKAKKRSLTNMNDGRKENLKTNGAGKMMHCKKRKPHPSASELLPPALEGEIFIDRKIYSLPLHTLQ